MNKAKLTARPIGKQSAPDYVVEQIKTGLIERSIRPGDRLPSEPELAELYGVSRGSIRQAMKSLEMLGVISIRPGDGSYVNDSISANNLNPLAFAMLAVEPSGSEFSNARLILELSIMKLVLDNPEALEAAMPRLEANVDMQSAMIKHGASIEDMVENDKHFHMLLAEACGNRIMQAIYGYVIDSFSAMMVYTTKMQNRDLISENTADHHTSILKALKTGNYEKVEQAVRQTMEGWGSLLEAIES